MLPQLANLWRLVIACVIHTDGAIPYLIKGEEEPGEVRKEQGREKTREKEKEVRERETEEKKSEGAEPNTKGRKRNRETQKETERERERKRGTDREIERRRQRDTERHKGTQRDQRGEVGIDKMLPAAQPRRLTLAPLKLSTANTVLCWSSYARKAKPLLLPVSLRRKRSVGEWESRTSLPVAVHV